MLHVVGSLDSLSLNIDKPILDELDARKVSLRYWPAPDSVSGMYDKTSLWSYEAAARHWSSEAADMLHELHSGDKILWCDFWNPGTTLLAYARFARGLDIESYAVYAASSVLLGDFSQKVIGAQWFEQGWADQHKKIFTPSTFAERRLPDFWPTVKTGLPFYSPAEPVNEEREPIILFPHRTTMDKNGMLAQRVIETVLVAMPEATAYVAYPLPKPTTHLGDRLKIGPWRRSELLELMGRASVCLCTAPVETFGYAWREAAVRGCRPVAVPMGVYADDVFAHDRHTELEDLIGRCIQVLKEPNAGFTSRMYRQLFEKYADVASRIVNEMGY